MTESREIVTLRDYVDLQIGTVRREMAMAQRNQEIALDKAALATDYRLKSMNEFRASLRDQTASYLTRNEYEGKHYSLIQEIKSLQRIVYMGLGGVVVLQFILSVLLPYLLGH